MENSLLASIESCIAQSSLRRGQIASYTNVSGGCINEAYSVLLNTGERLFVKVNHDVPEDFFEHEANGIKALQSALDDSNPIRIPKVIGFGRYFLVLEWIESGSRPRGFFESFGRGLAQLHHHSNGDQFGFANDNYLGTTLQPNPWESDWTQFFASHRLGHQLELAKKNGVGSSELLRKGEQLIEQLEKWIGGEKTRPSLIHGDLWNGNYMCDERGRPVLVDPAPYLGVGEAEFGMTTLFGGFDESFYEAYKEAIPEVAGFQQRVEIYRLYHLLNHLNLFGNSYLQGCLAIVRKYTGK